LQISNFGGVRVVILLWAKCVIVVVVLKCMRTLLDECFFVAQHDVGPFKSVNVSVSDFDFSLNILICIHDFFACLKLFRLET
jgi:hypothetical protein